MVSTSIKFDLNGKKATDKKAVSTHRNEAFNKKFVSLARKTAFIVRRGISYFDG